jgi:hypothetical protein
VLQGALAGALTGGALGYLNSGAGGLIAAGSVAPGTVGGFVGNFTINTAVRALMQGKITDQMLLTNLASAEGSTLAANLEAGISKSNMSPTEAFAARTLAKVLTSAVKALGSRGDPNYAFASGLITDVMQPLAGDVKDAVLAGNGPAPYDMDAPVAAGGRSPTPPPMAFDNGPPAPTGLTPPGPVSTGYVPPQAPSDTAERGPVMNWGEPDVDVSGDQTQRIIVTGRALPRDANGNRLVIDAQGNGLVLLKTGGMVSLGHLDADFARELSSTAALGGAYLSRFTAGTGTTALGEVLTAGRALIGGAVDAAGRVISNTGAGLVEGVLGISAEALGVGALLLVTPSTIGQRNETYLGDNMRFVQQSDMIYGQLQERNANGDWETTCADVRGYSALGRFVVLSDDELRRLNQPTTTPIPPQQPNGPPPLLGSDNRPNPLPGYRGNAPTGPTTHTTPAAPAQN